MDGWKEGRNVHCVCVLTSNEKNRRTTHEGRRVVDVLFKMRTRKVLVSQTDKWGDDVTLPGEHQTQTHLRLTKNKRGNEIEICLTSLVSNKHITYTHYTHYIHTL